MSEIFGMRISRKEALKELIKKFTKEKTRKF